MTPMTPMTPMKPEHLDALRRALPAIATDKIREALVHFLSTGQSPSLSECTGMMPGLDRLHERYAVHFLENITSTGRLLSLDECIKGMLELLPPTQDDTNDDDDTRPPH